MKIQSIFIPVKNKLRSIQEIMSVKIKNIFVFSLEQYLIILKLIHDIKIKVIYFRF